MNDRIKELAGQARLLMFTDDKGHHYVSDGNLQRFAELIVKECLSIVEPTEDSGDEWCVTLKGAAQEIKEHFGVEE